MTAPQQPLSDDWRRIIADSVKNAGFSVESFTHPLFPLKTMTKRDPAVDHPDHYNSNPSGVECIDVVEHMGFNVGNAVKYLWRAGSKGDVVEDLKKARWYVEREIARIEKERTK